VARAAKTTARGRKKPAPKRKPPAKKPTPAKRTSPRATKARATSGWLTRLRAWSLRGSFERQFAARFGEERLLFYVAATCFAAYLVGLPDTVREAGIEGGRDALLSMVAGKFVAIVIFGPLFLYGVAGLSHSFCHWAFGGSGTYFKARLALFWSLVLGVPLVLINAGGDMALRSIGADEAVLPFGIAIFGLWLWIWTSGLAIAERFSRLGTFFFTIGLILCASGLVLIVS